MSALGQKQTLRSAIAMSALHPKSVIERVLECPLSAKADAATIGLAYRIPN
jgi:hypothetical protein